MTTETAERPDVRLAEAVTEIRRNGKVYVPNGERMVPVDHDAYIELLALDGITPISWDDLPAAPNGRNLPAVIPGQATAPEVSSRGRRARQAPAGDDA